MPVNIIDPYPFVSHAGREHATQEGPHVAANILTSVFHAATEKLAAQDSLTGRQLVFFANNFVKEKRVL